MVFPTVVGRPRDGGEQVYVGDQAQSRRSELTLTAPVRCGVVTDWAGMEAVYRHALRSELGVVVEQHPLLLTEPPLNPRHNREEMTRLVFETFKAPAMYTAVQAVLALYATGHNTGLVMDIGGTIAHAVPVYEGYALPHAMVRLDIAGTQLTSYLLQMLAERGFSLTTQAEREHVRQMKEDFGFVASSTDGGLLDGDSELERTYTLPDGQQVTLASERFRCTEPLFSPSLLGQGQSEGIHMACYKAAMSCDMDIRPDLYAALVLAGGSSMFPGLADRLSNEMAAVVPWSIKVNVLAPPTRKFSSWTGGSVFATLPTLPWISLGEFLDGGPAVVSRITM